MVVLMLMLLAMPLLVMLVELLGLDRCESNLWGGGCDLLQN